MQLRCFEVEELRTSQSLILQIRRLAEETAKFADTAGISQIYLRSQSESGKYPGHAFNFKIEAIVQINPDIELTFVNTNSVNAWLRREGAVQIAGTPGLRAREKGLQLKAIETALFAGATQSSRSFSDGKLPDE